MVAGSEYSVVFFGRVDELRLNIAWSSTSSHLADCIIILALVAHTSFIFIVIFALSRPRRTYHEHAAGDPGKHGTPRNKKRSAENVALSAGVILVTDSTTTETTNSPM